jgi:hypothetical protein
MNTPHTNNSFSYKTIHPIIKNILDERSTLDNTIQVGMPFVKATTTLNLPDILGSGIGFTLGIHATQQDILYQDMYGTQNGKYLVGYTYLANGQNQLIYADLPSDRLNNILNILDIGDEIDNKEGYTAVPPPGITRVSIGKRRSGLISVANINFSVPTLWQLEFLHKTFLIPGVGMVLEWGQQFAPKQSNFGLGETGLIGNLNEYMFPWYGVNAQGDELFTLFRRLARNEVGVQEILEKYSYPTQGQYQWMFGRVGNFTVNSNPDGSYECMVRIVGPSEDSWAYSVRNTSVPRTKRGGETIVCIDNTNSVEQYFARDSGTDSFIGILEGTINRSLPGLEDWKDFVKKFEKPSMERGGIGSIISFITSQKSNDDLEDAYFISWRYFVNVILNDEVYGIKSIFTNANELPDWLDKISILRKYNNINGNETDTTNFEDPFENFVGNNLFLRSTDLSTMVIVNETAARKAFADDQRKVSGGGDEAFYDRSGKDTEGLHLLGDFFRGAQNVTDPPSNSSLLDRGFLSTGVWINHKAIIQCFSTANTIIDGIQALLSRMNVATNGYWNLAIDISEPFYSQDIELPEGSLNIHSYSVVDLNYVESSQYAVQQFLTAGNDNRVYIFNKYIRNRSGRRLGSELTSCNVELSMPQTMFSQIATLGIVHPDDSLEFTEEGENEPSTISNVNHNLRQMFSITSIARREDGSSADLTALTYELEDDIETCSGNVSSRDVAGTTSGGRTDRPISELNTEEDIAAETQKSEQEIQEILEFIESCKENCEEEVSEVDENTINLSRELAAESSRNPWSARFISYVVGNIDPTFPKNASHTGYAQAIRSRPTTGQLADWTTLDPTTTTPQRGDILIYNSRGNNLTFSSSTWSGRSHGDIVTEVSDTSVSFIGGNLTKSVRNLSHNIFDGIARGKTFFAILRNESKSEQIASAAEAELRAWNATINDIEKFRLIQKYNSSTGDTTLTQPVTEVLSRFTSCKTSDTAGTFVQLSTGAIAAASLETIITTAENCNTALDRLRRAQQRRSQLERRRTELSRVKKIDSIKREFPHLEKLYIYLEPYPDYMVSLVRKLSDGNSSNAFGSAPGTLSIKANLELPGINGFRLGELFWIDRMPSYYKAFGAFIILGVEEEITPGKWTTKIGSSFYYLGNAWKQAMFRILTEAGQ